ncbi:glycosyltransferase family 2 protein [Streptomyces sp. NPDC060022]|uniref:glycosyltransferase family 2 protein n=1 Tax=Streptomyces sp. NPDC060022 TaxID=3347039 RepID=UPI0036835B37
MNAVDLTLIVTVRERFSYSRESLENLIETADCPYKLVYVDINSPGPVASYLKAAAEKHSFTLVRLDHYVSPNEARNIGLRHAEGEYVVFLDNDVEFTPGWLSALVRCAREENASLVGPLYLHGRLEDQSVHMAGGDMSFSGTWGSRDFTQTQRYFMKNLAEVPESELTRQQCDIVEFHCALVRRDVFDRVGGMDEGLLTTREHLDFCQRVLDSGGTVYFEPESVITYRMPPPFETSDLPYFMLRWSDEWTRKTLVHFAHKHGIAPSYVQRVAKNRRRRQSLLFQWAEPRIRPVLGSAGTSVAKKIFSVVEPLGNRLLVTALTRRGHGGGAGATGTN